jgi:hypothetical protein
MFWNADRFGPEASKSCATTAKRLLMKIETLETEAELAWLIRLLPGQHIISLASSAPIQGKGPISQTRRLKIGPPPPI